MHITHSLQQRDPRDVINVACNNHAIQQQPGRLPVVADSVGVEYKRHPHDHGAYYGEECEDAREKSPERKVLHSEDEVAQRSCQTLYYRDQRNAQRISLNRSEEHTSELQSRENLVCRLLLEKKKNKILL